MCGDHSGQPNPSGLRGGEAHLASASGACGGCGTNTPQGDGCSCCFFLGRQRWKGVCFLGLLDGTVAPGSPSSGVDSGIFGSPSSFGRSDPVLCAARPGCKKVPGCQLARLCLRAVGPRPLAGAVAAGDGKGSQEDDSAERWQQSSPDPAQRPPAAGAAWSPKPGEARASRVSGGADPSPVPSAEQDGCSGAATPVAQHGNCFPGNWSAGSGFDSILGPWAIGSPRGVGGCSWPCRRNEWFGHDSAWSRMGVAHPWKSTSFSVEGMMAAIK